MKILGTQYTLDYNSFDIYVSGCKGINGVHCKNCHNPESWSFDNGDLLNEELMENIINKINKNNNMIENIMIFGGEPLDQKKEELIYLLENLKVLNKNIWLFTRKELNEIDNEIINLCDYIKTGSYKEDLKTENNIQYNIKLSTSNQNIFKIKNE